jgi:hypothetical protein
MTSSTGNSSPLLQVSALHASSMQGSVMQAAAASGVAAHEAGALPARPASTGSARTADRTAARRLPFADYLTILAIVAVVVVVTIPRLRGFAVRENETDAIHMLRALAMQPARSGHDQDVNDLAHAVARDPAMLHRLEDVECLEDGSLRRHGYLFDMTMLRQGEPMLRAWPWNHGQTGNDAFVWTPQRGLLWHANADGRFSGPGYAPGAADIDTRSLAASGWARIPDRR